MDFYINLKVNFRGNSKNFLLSGSETKSWESMEAMVSRDEQQACCQTRRHMALTQHTEGWGFRGPTGADRHTGQTLTPPCERCRGPLCAHGEDYSSPSRHGERPSPAGVTATVCGKYRECVTSRRPVSQPAS